MDFDGPGSGARGLAVVALVWPYVQSRLHMRCRKGERVLVWSKKGPGRAGSERIIFSRGVSAGSPSTKTGIGLRVSDFCTLYGSGGYMEVGYVDTYGGGLYGKWWI